jgi:hypothetical protein
MATRSGVKMARRSWLGVSAAGLIALAPAAAAQAAPTTLSVANHGQPGLVSTVPQAPVLLSARGTCDQPRAVEEANGAASACPPGTWPVQGGPDWFQPTPVDVAGGDGLQLTFDVPVTSVATTITTQFPIGLTTPGCPTPPPGTPVGCTGGGQAIQNTGSALAATPVPPTDASAPLPAGTASTTWAVIVPAGLPNEVAVTATGPTGPANFVFGVAIGRFEDETARCGLVFSAPGQTSYRCESASQVKGGPPGSGGATGAGAPVATPRATLALHGAKPSLRGRTLSLGLNPSTPGTLTVTLSYGRHRLLRRELPPVAKAGPVKRTLTLSRALGKALARHPKRRYVLEVSLAGGAGQPSVSTTVRWRR